MAKSKNKEQNEEEINKEMVEEAAAPPGEEEAENPPDDQKADKERFLRLAAEYDNFRKRSQKERETIFVDVRADTIVRLLPVYDNLMRALGQNCSDEAFYKGVEMTMTQLVEILGNMGVTEIPAVGEVFNPERHNAILTVEDPELDQNIVKEEIEKGFMLGNKVIRFSSVIVANCG